MRVALIHFLTLLFVILKLTGTITWSWWWVMSPSIFSLVVLAAVGLFFIHQFRNVSKKGY